MYFMIKMQIKDLVNQVDKDGTGSIDLPEFLMMMVIKAESENAEDEIREAFTVFDSVGYNNYKLKTVPLLCRTGTGL